tara:strand:- start:148 stop:852 length:705 start_codon:yes stop_codon:yes gene_type:complete
MNNILLTGASSEIGKEFLIQNNSSKNVIYAHYNSSKNFSKFLKLIKLKSRIKLIKCDFSKENELGTFLKKIKNIKFDKIIHLAAKPVELIRFTELNTKHFLTEYKISFFSIFKILQKTLPIMQERKGGDVIFVLSSGILENKTTPYFTHYNCLKFQLLGLIKSLTIEYEKSDINFVSISPDIMDTKFLRNIDKRLLYLNKKNLKFLKVKKVVKKINKVLKNGKKFNGKNLPILT